MRLKQNQVWEKNGEYIRVVHLERLAVTYKLMKSLEKGEGVQKSVTKKEFCQLLKGAELMP